MGILPLVVFNFTIVNSFPSLNKCHNMNLCLQHSEQRHLPKPLKMTTWEPYLKDKSFCPQVYSTCNCQWLRNAMVGLTNSSQELSKKVKWLSKSTQSLPHWERSQRSLRLTQNHMLKSPISTTSRSPKCLREGEWDLERRRPLTHPDCHVALPIPLQDQNQELHPLILMQQSGKRKRSMNLTYPWVIQNQLLRVELCPKLCAMLKLLQAWSANPKQVKSSIINTLRCPAFPDSEWLNLIPGKAINLNNIFSSFYSITNVQNPLEKSSSNLEQRTHPNQLLHMGIGPSHLTLPLMPICSHLPTELKSSSYISTTSYSNLQLNTNPNILGSSLLTEQSRSEYLNIGICSSPTLTSSTTCKWCTSITTVQLNQGIPQEVVSSAHLINLLQRDETNPVRAGIKEHVGEERTVTTSTSVNYVSKRADQRQVPTGKKHCVKVSTARWSNQVWSEA